jgi:predicted enzyme related to lactoylglutathione lyase
MEFEFYASRFVLAVNNLRKSTDFFMDILGFTRDFGDESDGWSFLSRGNVRVMLGECVGETPAGELGNHSYFAYMNVRDADKVHAEIVARGGIPWALPVNKPWNIREFGITTPDGHRIVFGQTL